MKLPNDQTDPGVRTCGGVDVTSWKREVNEFLTDARQEVRQIRDSLAAESSVREPSVPPIRDILVPSEIGDDTRRTPASGSSVPGCDTTSLQSLKQRLAEQLDRCAATAIGPRDSVLDREDIR